MRLREPLLYAVAAFVDALSRDARKKRGAIATHAPRGVGEERRLRATRKLVGLRQQHEERNVSEPIDELLVERREWMARIHHHHYAGKARCGPQVSADELAPMRAHANIEIASSGISGM